MAAVRDFADELEGYAYFPRMFDKARARLSGDTDAPPFGCPLDHSCLARLRVYPENVLELVSGYGDDDRAISMVSEITRQLLTAYLEEQFADRPDLLPHVVPAYPLP